MLVEWVDEALNGLSRQSWLRVFLASSFSLSLILLSFPPFLGTNSTVINIFSNSRSSFYARPPKSNFRHTPSDGVSSERDCLHHRRRLRYAAGKIEGIPSWALLS